MGMYGFAHAHFMALEGMSKVQETNCHRHCAQRQSYIRKQIMNEMNDAYK